MALVGFAAFGAAGAAQAECADVALVLAVDASGSIGSAEFALQQTGYAAAFRSVEVQRALAAAGKVDVAMVLWGDSAMEPQILDWQRVEGPEDAGRLAARIAGLQRTVTGDTGIGSGIRLALALLQPYESCGSRRLINVSGDGRESFGARPDRQVPMVVARAEAEAAGVVINGLAITTDDPDLAAWYGEKVILGEGAFVMEVARFDDFGAAIIQKLVREVGPPMLAGLGDAADRRE